MPGGDRTGPAGMGPMTGRAAGYCVGATTPGFMNDAGGRGFGGGGGGRGRRNRFYATGLTGWQQQAAAVAAQQATPATQPMPNEPPVAAKEQELDILRQQAGLLEQQMLQLKERMDQLEVKS